MNFTFKNVNFYKTDLAIKARKHNDYMKTLFQTEIYNSILKSKIYTQDNIKYSENGIKPNIQIVDTDTVSALFMICDFYKNIGILNFASYKYPGGMFLKGSTAQEESLCHESDLFEILSYFDDYYYKTNRNEYKLGLINNLYSDRGIYSPEVLFIKNNENTELSLNNKTFANVISVAAPNIRNIYDKNILRENGIALNNRIKFVLDIAESEKIDTLILGAFGCGVFRQNPKEVASIFKKYLLSEKYNFTNVIFAIPYSDKNNNYKAFVEVLKDSLTGVFIDK